MPSRGTTPYSQIRWLDFRNDSGETAPAFAVMKVAGMENPSPGKVVLVIDKPDTYGSQYNHVINGRLPVGIGKHGVCSYASDGPVAAIFNSEDDLDPDFGTNWGPKPSSWKLHRYVGGFEIVKGDPDSTGRVLVQQSPWLQGVGKSDENITPLAAATVSIYHGTDALNVIDSGFNIEVFNRGGQTIKVGSWLHFMRANQDWETPGTPEGAGNRILLGKTVGASAVGASATVQPYNRDSLTSAGSETTDGATVTAYNRYAAIADAKWVHVLEFKTTDNVTAYEIIQGEAC